MSESEIELFIVYPLGVILVGLYLFGLYKIIKEPSINDRQRTGWFIVSLFSGFAGLIPFFFFREKVENLIKDVTRPIQ